MTTPALARVAARRLHTQACRDGNQAGCDANLAEVMEALDAWEALMRREREREEPLTGPEQADGWRTTRDHDCSYTEGYDHSSGAWCRKLAAEKREWYVGRSGGASGVLREFKSADEAKEYALAMVKP